MVCNVNGHFDNCACSFQLQTGNYIYLIIWKHNPNTDNLRERFFRRQMSWFQQKFNATRAQCLAQHCKTELRAELWHSLPVTSSNGARKSVPTEQKMVPCSHLSVNLPREGKLLKFPFTFSGHSSSAKSSQVFFLNNNIKIIFIFPNFIEI